MLRVISGTAKGFRLKTPKGMKTRPTSDRIKESVFNIINPHIEGADVLDLFAGSGNLGIEALSRGAKSAVFVDKSKIATEIIKENLTHTGLLEKATIEKGTVEDKIQKMSQFAKKFDIILMDPPYNAGIILDTLNSIEKKRIMRDNGIIVVERDKRDSVPEIIGEFILYREQTYGSTVVSFYRKNVRPASI